MINFAYLVFLNYCLKLFRRLKNRIGSFQSNLKPTKDTV